MTIEKRTPFHKAYAQLVSIESEPVKRLVARCEANEVTFDNADMSAALFWGQQWMAETNRLRSRLEFLLGFDDLDDLTRDVIAKALELSKHAETVTE